MLVSGHNISTTEVESALVSHPAVAEAAVVGATDPVTGQAIVAFPILRGGAEGDENLLAELREHVGKTLGAIAKPRQIMVVPELPKTRSGKIMRRLLRDVAENRSLGDVTTLQDSAVMQLISEGMAIQKPRRLTSAPSGRVPDCVASRLPTHFVGGAVLRLVMNVPDGAVPCLPGHLPRYVARGLAYLLRRRRPRAPCDAGPGRRGPRVARRARFGVPDGAGLGTARSCALSWTCPDGAVLGCADGGVLGYRGARFWGPDGAGFVLFAFPHRVSVRLGCVVLSPPALGARLARERFRSRHGMAVEPMWVTAHPLAWTHARDATALTTAWC